MPGSEFFNLGGIYELLGCTRGLVYYLHVFLSPTDTFVFIRGLRRLFVVAGLYFRPATLGRDSCDHGLLGNKPGSCHFQLDLGPLPGKRRKESGYLALAALERLKHQTHPIKTISNFRLHSAKLRRVVFGLQNGRPM